MWKNFENYLTTLPLHENKKDFYMAEKSAVLQV